MVERLSALVVIVLLVIVCPSTHSMESLKGPTFSNSSGTEVGLSVSSEGKSQELLRAFPAHQLIAMPRELRVQSIYVVAGERRYELDEGEYVAQSSGLSQRRQLWIFDGQRLCVRDISQMKDRPHSPPTCEGIGTRR
jgi:hypothetical protein